MDRGFVCSALIALFWGCGVADAKDYCPPRPKAQEEGDTWYIPESAFTKKAANEALENLRLQVNKEVDGDFDVDNHLVMIKGYLWIAYLKKDLSYRKSFCEFLLREAYVRH